MRRIYVRLDRNQVDTLVRVSEAERRHPSDQAAVMLARVLAERNEERKQEVQVK